MGSRHGQVWGGRSRPPTPDEGVWGYMDRVGAGALTCSHWELHMKKPSVQVGLGIALGAGIGATVAVVLGSGGAWLAIGIAVGIVIGLAMSKQKAGSSPLEAVRNDKRF